MSPLLSIAFALTVSVAAVAGNCCAPQPVTIQLSCNGQSKGPKPSAPQPPPADGQNFGIPPGYNEHSCEFDDNGYPTSNPPGGFPPGYHVIMNELGEPEARADDPFIQMPPRHWDGDFNNMGFPMPPPGTPHYNMIMCTPIPVPVISPGK